MIEICDAPFCKPLKLVFGSCLGNGKFSTEWKKANVVPAHKKGKMFLLEKYLKEYCIIACMNSLQKII